MSAEHTVTVRELSKILGVSEPTLRRLRKDPDFPKRLAMPGRPRWARAAVEKFLNQRDAGEVAAGAFLASGPDLAGLSAEEQHAAALRYFAQLEQDALARDSKAAQAFRWAIEAIELAGPRIMAPAARFLSRTSLVDSERPA